MKNSVKVILIGILLSTCSNNNDSISKLIESHIHIAERVNSELYSAIEDNLYMKTTFAFHMQDPQFKKYATIANDELKSIRIKVNEIDDFLLKNLNQLIESEGNKSNWIIKDNHTQKSQYEPLININNLASSTMTTIKYGNITDEANQNSDSIRMKLHSLRNIILYTISDSLYDYRNKLVSFDEEDFKEYSVYKKKLEKTGYKYKNDLLEIHALLSIPEKITINKKVKSWNLHLFEDKPLIGSALIFSYWRLDIRKAQKLALKILFENMYDNQQKEIMDKIFKDSKSLEF